MPEKVVYGKEDMFEKKDDELLKGSIFWLVPSAQKSRMESVLVTLGPGGRSAEFPAHEGEEFSFVLTGRIELIAGHMRYKILRGESFSLHPDAPDFIENPGRREARFLWASTPKSF